MKHNVNLGLLGLLLLVILAMIGLTIYNYMTYEGLNSKYDEALENLENYSDIISAKEAELAAKEGDLRDKEAKLAAYLSELNISKQRETSLGGHFEELKGEVGTLEGNLNSTKEERDRYAQLYNKYLAESQQWKSQYEEEHLALTKAEQKITDVRRLALDIGEYVKSINATLKSIRGDAYDIGDDASDIDSNSGNKTFVENRAGEVEDKADNIVSDIDSIWPNINEINDIGKFIRGAT